MQVKNHGKYSQSLEAIKTRTMKQQFDKIVNTIDSIENFSHVETCETMIKLFRKANLEAGHDYSMNLLGYLTATIKHKLQ